MAHPSDDKDERSHMKFAECDFPHQLLPGWPLAGWPAPAAAQSSESHSLLHRGLARSLCKELQQEGRSTCRCAAASESVGGLAIEAHRQQGPARYRRCTRFSRLPQAASKGLGAGKDLDVEEVQPPTLTRVGLVASNRSATSPMSDRASASIEARLRPRFRNTSCTRACFS